MCLVKSKMRLGASKWFMPMADEIRFVVTVIIRNSLFCPPCDKPPLFMGRNIFTPLLLKLPFPPAPIFLNDRLNQLIMTVAPHMD